MKVISRTLITLIAGLLVSLSVYAKEPIYTGFFNDKAVSGYDPVAYFTDHKPVKGKAKFSTKYMGADWEFASQEHLDMFVMNPEKYAPQFGGYCAWAVSANKAFASGDPEQWAIVDGKLYLNYDAEVKVKWDADRALHIKQANENWPAMISKK